MYRENCAPLSLPPRPARIWGHWWTRLRRKLMFVGQKRWSRCHVCARNRLLKNLVRGRWGGGPDIYVCRYTKLGQEKYASCMDVVQHLKWS